MELGPRAYNKHLMTAAMGEEFDTILCLQPGGVSWPPLVLQQYSSESLGLLLLIHFLSLEELMVTSFKSKKCFC